MQRFLLRSLTVAATGLAAGVAPAPAAAQAPASPPAETLSPRDSARLLRAAREEQARFERVRRSHLPWAWGGGSGECDERIGRFCLTHGGGDESWEPSPEAEEVTDARDRLLERLAETERAVPGDGWIAGQRIRYLLEARRFGEARAASGACGAADWWCAALAGFALHYSGRPGEADEAFSAALRRMPDDVRRDWTDLSHLLDPRGYQAYRRLDGEERERFEARFWRLADPFFMRPGNELRSEHLARSVWDVFQDRAKSAENLSWGGDLREILLRYGWPSGWERIRDRPGSLSPAGMLTHYSGSDRNLLPPTEVLVTSEIAEGSWDEESERPRTGYALPLADTVARWLDSLDHQLAVFRRGDSARVVAAYELPADSFPADARIDAALALYGDGETPAHVSPFPAGGPRGVQEISAAPGRHLVSLEIVSEEARRAARARRGLRVPPLAPGLVAVSDLLLLRSADELPDSLEAALRNVRGGTRVSPGERLGVYWEVYGLERERSVTMSLRLLEEGRGWLERMAEKAGLLSASEPIRLRWQEGVEPAPFVARSLAVQIPEVEPGRYSLELSVTLPGREPLVVTRALEVK